MARSSARGTGNRPKDQESINWMVENGGVEPIDPEEEGIPWPTKTRWNGHADQEGSPWLIPPPGNRCTGKSYLRDEDGDYVVDVDNVRIRRPCGNWPMKGMTVCLKHGGGIAAVRKAAMERMASALDASTGRLIRMIFSDKTDEPTRLKAITQLMDRVGVRGGQEVDIRTPGWERVVERMFMHSPEVEAIASEEEDDEYASA